MSKRAILGLLLQMICGTAMAAEADLAVVSLVAPRNATTGERITISASVRNDGPDDATSVLAQLGVSGKAFAVAANAPAGWTCTIGNPLFCRAQTLARFTEASFELTLLAPAEPGDVNAFSHVISTVADPNRNNNLHSLPLTIAAADTNAELSIVSPSEELVRPGSPGRVELAVKNAGPDAARNVHLSIGLGADLGAVVEGNGWTCNERDTEQFLCIRSSIAPGETAPVIVRFTAPANDAAIPLYAQAHAESNRENDGIDNLGTATIFVGAAEAWQRMLLPLTATNVPGANGSLWKTDIAVLISVDTPVNLRPNACENTPVICIPPLLPLRRPFDARDSGLIVEPVTPGQFLYVRAADASKIHFSTRAYDSARAGETTGAEIPVVREHEFRTSTISLLNLPVSPDYRHTLRVYDADARAGASVIVRVFAGTETTPRFERMFALTPPSPAQRTTTARLPVHPGYLQLDLAEAIGVAGGQAVRVDVVPVTAGLRFWGFVSITNNRTHHVTTVTPQ